MNEQLYGGHEEGSRMTDKPEITVDEALLAELSSATDLDRMARMSVSATIEQAAAGVADDAARAYLLAVRDPDTVRALVEELRVAWKATEIAAAPFRLFCHSADGRSRCPLYTFTPPGECGSGIQINSDRCKRLRVEHATREARVALNMPLEEVNRD